MEVSVTYRLVHIMPSNPRQILFSFALAKGLVRNLVRVPAPAAAALHFRKDLKASPQGLGMTHMACLRPTILVDDNFFPNA